MRSDFPTFFYLYALFFLIYTLQLFFYLFNSTVKKKLQEVKVGVHKSFSYKRTVHAKGRFGGGGVVCLGWGRELFRRTAAAGIIIYHTKRSFQIKRLGFFQRIVVFNFAFWVVHVGQLGSQIKDYEEEIFSQVGTYFGSPFYPTTRNVPLILLPG